MSEIITVANVEGPAPGKKQGRVTDTQGRKWQIWGDKLHDYSIGVTYEVTKVKSNYFNGQQYVTIMESHPVGGSSGGPIGQPVARSNTSGSTITIPLPESNKDEQIFVCGALNNTLANPNINPMSLGVQDLVGLVNAYRDTWRNTFGRKPATVAKPQSAGDDMEDSVPF